MTQKPCPATEDLKSFVRCEVSEQQAAQIEQHLEACPKCEETVVGMERDVDTVANQIRKAATQQTFADEPECQKMIKAMQDGRALEATQISGADSPAAGSSVEIPDGQVLRDYKIVAKLGEGGMGAVYKAVHQRLKKPVALKVMPTKTIGDRSAVARFEREMEVLGQLNHPHIVQALDAGEHEGQHYLVMEYVDGSDLSEITRRCSPLSVADACLMISQAAAGLQYAHENGFVHRDIKPSNLMLARGGASAGRSQAAVKILDLGLARALEQRPNAAGSAELTSAGQMMGTLDYMAPEQGGDAHQVDIRADIYSLGATLYKLLTGESPFAEHARKPMMQRLMAMAQNDPPPIRSKRADIPEKLAAIIHRMLAKRPEQRFATPAEVEEALKPFCANADLAALIVPDGETQVMKAPPIAQATPAVVLKPGAKPRTRTAIAGAMAILALAAVIVISTKHGTVEVTSPDGELPADVKVLVSRNGDEIEVLQSDNHWSAKLVNGAYQVSLRGGEDKFEIKDSKLIVSRMGRTRVELTLKPESVAAAAKPNPEAVTPAKVIKPQDDTKGEPHGVAKAANDKPFTIERDGKRMRSFKSLGAAYDETLPGDILLLEGARSITVKFPHITKPLHLKSVGEHRPLLVITNGADDIPHSRYMNVDSELVFDGCNIDAGESMFFVRGTGNLVVRGTRVWGGVTDIGRAQFTDSLLVGHSFSISRDEGKPSELSFENCAVRHIGQALVAAVMGTCELSMKNSTFFSRGGAFIAASDSSSINANAIGNLFDWDSVFVAEYGAQWHSMKGYQRVDWLGSENCYAGHWYTEYEMNDQQQAIVKAQGLAAWNQRWKQPEQNSREVPSMMLEFGRIQNLTAPERTNQISLVIDGLRKQQAMGEIGPDINLIGPGDPYVRALAAAGHPVPENELRPERPEQGPVLLLRNGKLIKAYEQLEPAMHDAIDGDVLELRTDGNVGVVSTAGTGRHMTIRSAPGYRPIIDAFGNHNDRVTLEGLFIKIACLASGGFWTGVPAKPFPSEGGFERIINCSIISTAENGQVVSGWLYPKHGAAPVVQNCDFSNVEFAVPPKTNATISNSILCWMRLTTTGTPETTSRVTFDRCLAWNPTSLAGQAGHVMVTSGTNRIEWNRSLFVTDYAPLPGMSLEDVVGFTGDKNVFMISTTWGNHRLDRFRNKFGLPVNGVELPPLEVDPAQWRIQKEMSVGYKPRPDGSDDGVDVDRLIKAITTPRRPE